MDYSCDQCKNRESKKCGRCWKTADKKPSRFKLDKSAVITPCAAHLNDRDECSLITSIRAWNEEIKQIDENIKSVEDVNMQVVLDFIVHMDKIRYLMYDGCNSIAKNKIVLDVVSDALHCVSYRKLIDTLTFARERESKLIDLRRQRNELQSKIDDAKRKLGI